MTEQEAIKLLEIRRSFTNSGNAGVSAIDMAISALEKQIAKKPLNIKKSAIEDGGYYGDCPCCNEHMESLWTSEKFCCNCGQKLDWSEV